MKSINWDRKGNFNVDQIGVVVITYLNQELSQCMYYWIRTLTHLFNNNNLTMSINMNII